MDIVVVGCGRAGAELAHRLFEKGYSVAVIDRTASAFANLPPDFRGRMLEGEALNRDLLKRAGIKNAHGLATVTNSDAINVVVAHVAKTVFGVPYVVARNYEPHRLNLFEIFEVQVVSSTSWGAKRIEELLVHPEFRTVFSAGNGEVEIYEFAAPKDWHGKTASELFPQHKCVLAGLTRAGVSIFPDASAKLQAGDLVLISATTQGINELRKWLKQSQEA